MALDCWFREELAQSIIAVAVAMLSASVANGASNIEHARGVIDTSRAQALNYGISWRELVADLEATLIDAGQNDLLDLVTKALPHG